MFLMEMYDQKARVMTWCHLAEPVTATTGLASVHRNCTHSPKCESIWQNRLNAQANWLQAWDLKQVQAFAQMVAFREVNMLRT